MQIQASLKVLPKGENRASSYQLVDEALALIIDSNLPFEIGVSETSVQGELDEVLELVKTIHQYYERKNVEFSFFLNSEYNSEEFYLEEKHENIKKILQ